MNVFIVSKKGIGAIIANHITKTLEQNAYILKKIDTSIIREKDKNNNLSLNDLPITLSDQTQKIPQSQLTSADIEEIRKANNVYLGFDTTPYGQNQIEKIIKQTGVKRTYLRIWIEATTPKNISHAIQNAKPNDEYKQIAVQYEVTKSTNYLVGMNISILYNAIAKIIEKDVTVSVSRDKLLVLKGIYRYMESNKDKGDNKDKLNINAHTEYGILRWQPAKMTLNEHGEMTNASHHYETLRKLTKSKKLVLKNVELKDKQTLPPPAPLNPHTLFAKLSQSDAQVSFKDVYSSLKILFYKGFILNPDSDSVVYKKEHVKLGDAFIKTLNKINHPLAKCAINQAPTVFKTLRNHEHGALMPLYNSIARSKNLKGLERRLYTLIAKNFAAQYCGPCEHQEISMLYACENSLEKFIHRQNKIIYPGWTILSTKQLNDRAPSNEIGPIIDVQKISQERISGNGLLTIVGLTGSLQNRGVSVPQAIESMKNQGYIEIRNKGIITPTQAGENLLQIIDKAPDFDETMSMIEEQYKSCRTESSIGPALEFVERKVSGYVAATFRLLDSENNNAHKCPDCMMGYLVKKHTDRGVFLGCCNYPVCEHSERA